MLKNRHNIFVASHKGMVSSAILKKLESDGHQNNIVQNKF